MKCPYPECQKDYSEQWPVSMNWFPSSEKLSIHGRSMLNRLFIVTKSCRFCNQNFYEIHVGHENFEDHTKGFADLPPTIELLVNFPFSKTRFEAKNVPKDVVGAFNEAERCRSVGSLTGTTACLRKAVYALCKAQGVDGENYRDNISNLPIKNQHHIELLKQIKWLGDAQTKPGGDLYPPEQIDMAIEILPEIIDELYLKDERALRVSKLLSKTRSSSGAKTLEKGEALE